MVTRLGGLRTFPVVIEADVSIGVVWTNDGQPKQPTRETVPVRNSPQETRMTTDEPSFDICSDTGGASAFFPSGHGALTGTFSEVSCSQWSGSDGGSLFNGACLSGETAGNWPAVGCGNKGENHLKTVAVPRLTVLRLQVLPPERAHAG